jgi:hypothetical protein
MNINKCSSCGSELSDGTKFCGACGTKVVILQDNNENTGNEHAVNENPDQNIFEDTTPYTEPTYSEPTYTEPTYTEAPYSNAPYSNAPYYTTPEQTRVKPAKPKAAFNFKKLIVPAAAVVVVIVAAIVLFNILSANKYEQVRGYIHISQDDDRVVIIPHRHAMLEIDGYLVNMVNSLDGATAIATIQEQRFGEGNTGNLLYLITDRAQLIAEGVLSAWLSASGSTIVYSKEFDPSTTTAELWQYTGGNHTRISNDFDIYGNCVVSPNGSDIAFTARDGDRVIGYLWDGRLTELGRDIIPIAISNSARQVYYFRDGVFFVQRGANSDNRERLGDASDVGFIFANRDLSQIVYTRGSRTYISNGGGAGESLSGAMSYFLLPDGTGMMWQRISHYSVPPIYICDMSGFADTFYLDRDSNIIRINNRFETNNIVRTTGNVSLARDGRTITYSRSRSIYQINGLNINAESVELVSGDVVTHVATSNGNAVFYVNDINELYYQRGTGRPVLVSNFISSAHQGYSLSLFNGQTLFYISDDELFSSTGDRGQLVSGIDGRVIWVFSNTLAVHVEVSDFGDYIGYISEDGKNFTRLD